MSLYVRTEDEFNILRRAEDMLDTTFRWNTKDDEMTGFVNEDEFEIIDELCSEIDRLKELIDDMKEKHEEEIREFYKPISPYEFYGVNERDF